MSEAAGLNLVRLPPATYPLRDSIPEKLIEKCLLSQLQLEGVLYGCQKHLELLPNSHRAGFFLGDGTGVGKGRQIAAMM